MTEKVLCGLLATTATGTIGNGGVIASIGPTTTTGTSPCCCWVDDDEEKEVAGVAAEMSARGGGVGRDMSSLMESESIEPGFRKAFGVHGGVSSPVVGVLAPKSGAPTSSAMGVGARDVVGVGSGPIAGAAGVGTPGTRCIKSPALVVIAESGEGAIDKRGAAGGGVGWIVGGTTTVAEAAAQLIPLKEDISAAGVHEEPAEADEAGREAGRGGEGECSRLWESISVVATGTVGATMMI